ncbi:RNA polymerase subunit sigma [Paraburkholderia sp. SARCC-3016]|nr:RNA polymerase subunit sigma [Paraburkholderia sp. SARCC-3016]MDQ7980771.1 RNA polymerase subunit sigma [Paraburkholderia sp. SARCC-3016]
MDTGDSRTAASSCAAAASLASSFELPAPGRFVTAATAFAACTGAARAAETVEVRFRAGVALSADVFVAEVADLASVTFVVGCPEPLPVAFFPPVVFTIAIAFRLCLEIKQNQNR